MIKILIGQDPEKIVYLYFIHVCLKKKKSRIYGKSGEFISGYNTQKMCAFKFCF